MLELPVKLANDYGKPFQRNPFMLLYILIEQDEDYIVSPHLFLWEYMAFFTSRRYP